MILEITTAPDEPFFYEDLLAFKEAVRKLGHQVHFIDVSNTWNEEQYTKKLENMSPHISRDYIRRKKESNDSSSSP